MKLKSLVFGCFMGLCSSVMAGPKHMHSQTADSKISSSYAPAWASSCEIEIINRSYDDVRVFGMFEDGVGLEPFIIYSFEYPHYISLYYNGYCHDGMELDIDTVNGQHVYGNYVRGGTTIRVVPYLMNQVKAELHAK